MHWPLAACAGIKPPTQQGSAVAFSSSRFHATLCFQLTSPSVTVELIGSFACQAECFGPLFRYTIHFIQDLPGQITGNPVLRVTLPNSRTFPAATRIGVAGNTDPRITLTLSARVERRAAISGVQSRRPRPAAFKPCRS